ncbi:hypothetical protein CK203_048639 [Vitis vinifera]|uniref:Ubiquitin-like protease family profile domain-containing protein n=1 Tax=Vitis vinifera TaxID=29760 RepID=A0A438HK22_VITVI|nr:hypothetical protein CK203_048639 [Vitis vinifera]
MGIRFRTFKYRLTKKYILPFKNDPEKLKKPPPIYPFIQEDHWRQFVKDRLSEHFNEYRKVQKSRRDKHIYNHYLGRKGYARFEQDILQAEGGIGRVDRSVLWKKAREKKGKFNKITEPVINMIDELLENAKEIGLPPPGPNDILGQALGKPDHPGRVVGQDRLVRPSSYFHQPSDDMKKIKEEIWEMVRKEMEDAATRQVMSPPTPHSDMGSNNMRQQLVLQPVVAEKPMFKMIEEPQPPEPPVKHKVIKCKLAVERKGNVVATGTLIEEKGSNRLVVINVAHKPDARFPFPNPYGIINVGDAIGFELDWPTSLVILETEHPQVLDKGKKKIVKTPIIRKSKPQNHSVIKNFQKFVDGCLGLSTPQIEKRAQLLSKRLMECQDAKYVFIPYNPDFHWVLVVIEPRKMIVHYLDPMHHKPCEDLKDIVNMALRISAKKTSKREPSWQLVQCPRQEGGFECGYFVMRFIKEIIFDPTIIASKFGDKKTYSQVEFDEIRGEWATFVLQLIMNHVDAS